jgi:hypothetical protein
MGMPADSIAASWREKPGSNVRTMFLEPGTRFPFFSFGSAADCWPVFTLDGADLFVDALELITGLI